MEERAWEYDALGNRVKDGKTEEDAWEYDAGHALTRVGAPAPKEPAGASAPQEPTGAGSAPASQVPAGSGSASAPQESVGADPRARPGREGTPPTGAQAAQTATPPARMSYGYDRNGSRTEEYREGKLWRRYSYDASGRLVRVEDADGEVLAEYGYDPFGRRMWKKVGEEMTYFLYTTDGLSAEYDAQGALIREYRWWPGAGWMREPVLQRAGGKLYWYRNDRLGRPWAMYDSDGTPRWLARQGPFGEKEDEWSKGVENPLRFPGQYHDAETGLHYNGHRYYDPETGSYLRRDPIGLAGGMSPYGYAGGNPLAAIDPLGLICHVKDGIATAIITNKNGEVYRVIEFPVPEGWNDIVPGLSYHVYRYEYSIAEIAGPIEKKLDNCVKESIRLEPTANYGHQIPAQPCKGSGFQITNDATPKNFLAGTASKISSIVFNKYNWVTSCLLDDKSVVNITSDMHFLHQGYVLIEVRDGKVHVFGEGNFLLQSNFNIFARWVEEYLIWAEYVEDIVNACVARELLSSTTE